MQEKIKEIVDYLKSKTNIQPKAGMILGSGLGSLADSFEDSVKIKYSDIPHFPVSTVEGHAGNLVFGYLADKPVVAMQGRFHFYEGYKMQEVTLPVRALFALGVKYLIVSNASGGLNPDYKVGEIMLINDHINHFNANPLIGKNDPELGPQWPDMSEPYDKEFIAQAKKIASAKNIVCHEGVYVGVSGPSYETKAEIRYFRFIGGDAVGMSTVPEVLVARHQEIPVLAISVITNMANPDSNVQVSHEEVKDVAGKSEKNVTELVKEFVARIKS